jgi:hypothetical protein
VLAPGRSAPVFQRRIVRHLSQYKIPFPSSNVLLDIALNPDHEYRPTFRAAAMLLIRILGIENMDCLIPRLSI